MWIGWFEWFIYWDRQDREFLSRNEEKIYKNFPVFIYEDIFFLWSENGLRQKNHTPSISFSLFLHSPFLVKKNYWVSIFLVFYIYCYSNKSPTILFISALIHIKFPLMFNLTFLLFFFLLGHVIWFRHRICEGRNWKIMIEWQVFFGNTWCPASGQEIGLAISYETYNFLYSNYTHLCF